MIGGSRGRPRELDWDHGLPDRRKGGRLWIRPSIQDLLPQITAHRGRAGMSPAPILSGAGSIWLGAFDDQADSSAGGGPGLRHGWCQRWKARMDLQRLGTVQLSFVYFNDAEPFGNTPRSSWRAGRDPGTEFPWFDGPSEPASGPGLLRSDDQPERDGRPRRAPFRIRFQFTPTVVSDEDGDFTTEYGPLERMICRSRRIVEGPQFFGFESGLEGGPRRLARLRILLCRPSVSEYTSLIRAVPFAGQRHRFMIRRRHPEGQYVIAWSPPVDRTIPRVHQIFADY